LEAGSKNHVDKLGANVTKSFIFNKYKHHVAQSAYLIDLTSSRPDFSTTKNNTSGSPSALGRGCIDMTDLIELILITAKLLFPEYVQAHNQPKESSYKSSSRGP
jgi:hypothetical protein